MQGAGGGAWLVKHNQAHDSYLKYSQAHDAMAMDAYKGQKGNQATGSTVSVARVGLTPGQAQNRDDAGVVEYNQACSRGAARVVEYNQACSRGAARVVEYNQACSRGAARVVEYNQACSRGAARVVEYNQACIRGAARVVEYNQACSSLNEVHSGSWQFSEAQSGSGACPLTVVCFTGRHVCEGYVWGSECHMPLGANRSRPTRQKPGSHHVGVRGQQQQGGCPPTVLPAAGG